jgi:hypothetical protein
MWVTSRGLDVLPHDRDAMQTQHVDAAVPSLS